MLSRREFSTDDCGGSSPPLPIFPHRLRCRFLAGLLLPVILLAADPPATTKPWTRWWWPGNAVDERLLSTQPQFEAELDRRRQRLALTSALSRLDAAKRTLIRMFYEEGVSIPEIARRQNSSVSAIKMQLLRARQELARMIGSGKKAREWTDKKSRSARTSRQSGNSSR